MMLQFTKMHGLGNDFVLIDAREQSVELGPERIRKLADRHFGIGCDQLLLLEAAPDDSVDVLYRIFNADGEEVEQCGNGARCVARYLYDHDQATGRKTYRARTLRGVIELQVDADARVRVDMGQPRFEPAALPLQLDASDDLYSLEVSGRTVHFRAVSMGNPHAIIESEDIASAPLDTLGAMMESHPAFPQRVNVGFMQIRDRTRLSLRVFERGVGETLACGTGACAAAVCAMRAGLLDSPARVELPGGTLEIEWTGGDAPVVMTGPAETVFTGTTSL